MKLGIDFGTCYSSAALLIDESLHPVKEPLKPLEPCFISSVCLTKRGELVISQAAENQRRLDPTLYCREFKRHLGEDFPYYLGERQLLPEELTAILLGGLKQEAEKMVNSPLSEAVITVPATYLADKRELMAKAAQKAGFEDVFLLEEPVAAAVYYARQGKGGHYLEDGEILLVYDLGGGTFDAALIQKQGNGYQLLCQPVGDKNCGGIDFDRAIFQDLKERYFNDNPILEILDPHRQDLEALRAKLNLEDWCRNFKHQLSVVSEYEDLPPIGSLPEFYSLSRSKFEAKIAPFIDSSCSLCEQLVQQSGIGWEKVNRILLVGGSCRIPYVQTRLEQQFNCPVVRVDEPELAICYGAALYGDWLATEGVQYYLQQGLEQSNQENYQQAIESFNQVIRFNSQSSEAYFYRGNAYYTQAEPKQAVADYDRALKLAPNLAEAYSNRALISAQQGNFQAALQDYDQALKLAPQLAEAKSGREFVRTLLKYQQQTQIITKLGSQTKLEFNLPLDTFEFGTVTVNKRGAIIKRNNHSAQYFTEDLGNGITLEMVAIPGGTFMMGTEDEEIARLVQKFNWDGFRGEKPQHKVTVQPFFMGKYPITQAQWRAVASLPKVKRYLDSDPSNFKGDNRPVEKVSWYDAMEFCKRLSKKTRRDYRLPSEAE